MGKKILFLGAAVFLLFCSCQSSPKLWEGSANESRLATVQFYYMEIDSYNGITVEKFNWVIIPAGTAELGGNVGVQHAGLRFYLKGMEFSCNFEDGKEYIVRGASENLLWGVSVYDVTGNKKISPETKIAFIPFKEQPNFN
jgi:hypothetical protein